MVPFNWDLKYNESVRKGAYMKYIRFEYKDEIKTGILENHLVKPVVGDKTLVDIIEGFSEFEIESVELDKVKILSPLERPIRNILCLGKNYKEHALEMKGKITDEVVIPDLPIYFSKACYKTIGTGDTITGHVGVSNSVDYEVELAIIIGKQGKDIAKSDVKDYIFGYTIANDISARDLQKDHYQWLKGKSLDGFCPLGPIVVTTDELSYPPDLKIQSYVNDDIRQNARTTDLIFDIDTIVSDLSKGMTLLPGDIILTGTPAGVGMGFKPPKYLKSGDEIRCEIESIGTLTNTLK